MRVLVDINIILDVLIRREPHFSASSEVWAAIETGKIEGVLAAHSVTTLFYLMSRHANWRTATNTVAMTMKVFSVASVDEETLKRALAWNWKDFEDAVQMATAVNTNADYLISRNPRDFEQQPVPVLQPAALPPLLPPTD